MKRNILYLFTATIITLTGVTGMAQELAPDQNPNYALSRDKYMYMADSINTWHSTTPQETYKAIDFLADRREAREERRAFRRELRMARVQNGYYYGDYYYPPNGFNNYNYNYYRPYRFRSSYYRNGFYRNTLPLAITLGAAGWWWCR